MIGIKYIISYLKKEKFLLIIASIFIVISTYLQVQTPKLMGNSISYLTNYAVLEQVQNSKDEIILQVNQGITANGGQPITIEQFENSLKTMSEAEIEVLLTQTNLGNAASIEEATGFSFVELMTEKPITQEEYFNDTMLLFGLAVLGIAVSIAIYYIAMSYIAAKSSNLMKIDLFRKLHDLAISYFDKNNDGDVLSVFTNDVDNISNLITQSLSQVLSSLVLLVAITYTMIKEQATLGLIILVLGLMLAVIMFVVMHQARKYVGKQQQKLGALNGYLDEQIAGQKSNISNGIEDYVFENFIPYNEDYLQNSIKGQTLSGMLMPIINGFMLLAIAIIIFVGSKLVLNQVIAIGSLVTFISFAQRFFQPFNTVASQYNMIQLGISGGERVSVVHDEVNDVVNYSNAQDVEGFLGHIEFQDVNFSYDGKTPILKNLNFEVQKGQMFAVVGPTGSGKTTIMNLLNRFYNISSGDILYDGLSINDITLETLRKNVGIVLQDSVLFGGTIFENIAYGKNNATKEEVIEAAKLAHIHDYIESLEKGYNTKISNDSGTFSVGQKQLISIARTILTNPDILILDEATSNVDTVTEAKIQQAMDNVIKGRTSFVIAHRLKTIINADIILVLKDGEVIQSGSHDKLLQEEGLYKELYTNQFVFEEKVV